ncbi:MAG: sulfite exporter TauE/SafE family protein [Ilumatobacter sp.]
MTSELIAIVLGLGVGGALGALGGGGSTLAVPILVFVAGLSVQDATLASLLVVGVAALFGASEHFRRGNARLGVGVAFGVAGIVGSRIGLLLNRSLDENTLLIAFALLIAFVALRMFRSTSSSEDAVDSTDPESVPSSGAPVATIVRPAATRRPALSMSALVKLAVAATLVGLLTGLFGVGGGFAVVPALTLLLGYPTKEAIGTSLVVIAVNAAVALGMRVGDISIEWAVVGPFLATVTAGVIVGTRLSAGIEAHRLTRAFAVMLGMVALYTAASTVVGP